MGRRPRPYYYAVRDEWRTCYRGRWLTAPTEAACWELLEAARAEEGRPIPGSPRTVVEAVEAWLVRRNRPARDFELDPFIAFAGDRMLDRLDPLTLLDYIEVLRKSYSADTVRRYYWLARQVLTLAAKRTWLRSMPLPAEKGGLPRPTRNPRGLTTEQLAAVFAALRRAPKLRFARRVLEFLVSTGARPSEALRLRWSDVDLEAGTVTLAAHKTAHATGEARTIYLTPPARAVLQESADALAEWVPPVEWVFPSLRFRRPYTVSGLRAVLRKAARSALGHEVTTYQLRHTFARLGRRVLAPDELRELMGHRDLRTTLLYYRLESEQARRAAAKLSALVPAAPAPSRPAPPSGRKGAARDRRGGRGRRG